MNDILSTEAHTKKPHGFGFELGTLHIAKSGDLSFIDKNGNEVWSIPKQQIIAYKPSHVLSRIKIYTASSKKSVYLWNLNYIAESNMYKWIRAFRRLGVHRKIF